MEVAGTVSQVLSISLGDLATGNAFGDLNATSPRSNGVTMLETHLHFRRQNITE
jgi:hypothetical protein